MKILLSTCRNPHFRTITEYVEEAFAETGHECVFFDDRDYLLPGRLRDGFRFLERWDLRRINAGLVEKAARVKPDLLLIAGGWRVSAETVAAVKKLGSRTALWTIDPPVPPGLARAVPFYDFVFCGGTEGVEILSGLIRNPQWLPFGCPASLLSTTAAPGPASDVCFVGSYYPNRAKIFESLADMNFRIIGPGWEKLGKNSPLKKLARPGQVRPEEWLGLYRSAKIVLCAHYQDGKIPCYQASPRVYEALGCGSFLLCDSQKDVLSLFKDGIHLAVWRDGRELRQKALYYLERPEERLAIARAGKAEVRAKHTYAARISEMLSVVSGRP